jgi:single-strand DNA-binding protein
VSLIGGYVSGVNVVTLIGQLATDVELTEGDDGKRVASFVLALARSPRYGGADLVRVCAREKQAELCDRFLAKGKRIALDGRLRSRAWPDSGGDSLGAVEVVASRIQFLSNPDSAGQAADARLEEAAV